MEESRQAKEAGFWGRQPAIKRDVPAYWSLATYGQPYHDARLALGTATNVFQVGWSRPRVRPWLGPLGMALQSR